MYDNQPGNVEHQFKILGTYYFDNGFEAGAIYNWNSGTTYNKASNVYGRYLPLREEASYDFGGYDGTWIADGNTASETTPSYGTLDVRVKYVHDFGGYQTEFFLDIFHVLDDQATIEEEQLFAGSASFDFGEAKDWVEPRRFYLGAKVLF